MKRCGMRVLAAALLLHSGSATLGADADEAAKVHFDVVERSMRSSHGSRKPITVEERIERSRRRRLQQPADSVEVFFAPGNCLPDDCGFGINDCFCDDECASFGDCCDNMCSVCGFGQQVLQEASFVQINLPQLFADGTIDTLYGVGDEVDVCPPTMMPTAAPAMLPLEVPTTELLPSAAPWAVSTDCSEDFTVWGFDSNDGELDIDTGTFETSNIASDGRVVSWLIYTETTGAEGGSCAGGLVEDEDTEEYREVAESTDPCTWVPYIANGWSRLPKCSAIDRSARHPFSIDLAIHAAEICCRECAEANAQSWARTNLWSDVDREVTIQFVANDAGVLWVNGERAFTDSTCSDSGLRLLRSVSVALTAGWNDVVVLVRNHGDVQSEGRPRNFGFVLAVPADLAGEGSILADSNWQEL
uniref:SMB domain-containing protein n=1 Tax=Phaeomonas parva TaxID=124430 RepID=A0A7S1TWG7_9STRA|mmetsp:Transcript_21189/g.64546  ORF Transcript_21189/g.64546 Transcript_21189/m.64546 type:complete len:417 (+) Transcript_21189:139-1389(+)